MTPAQRHNYLKHLAALTLTKLGDALTSPRLVLAWVLVGIGAPPMVLAMLVPVRESLALLPQIAFANYLNDKPHRKVFWSLGSVGQGAALAGMVAAILWLPSTTAAWTVLGCLAFFSLNRSLCSISIKDVMGRTVPKSNRGRLTGTASSTSGLLVFALALSIIFLGLQNFQNMEAFVVIFLCAAFLWWAAAAIYITVDEPTSQQQTAKNPVTAKSSFKLLGENRVFRQFLIARVLLVATAFAIPYIVSKQALNTEGALSGLGVLLAAEGLSGLVSGRVWGIWSDAAANKVMAAAATVSSVSIVSFLAAERLLPSLFTNIFFGGGILLLSVTAHHGVRIARSTYLVDLSSDENRAELTAVGNTFMGVLLLGGGLLGLIDQWLGTDAVLILLTVMGVLAAWYCARLPNVANEEF